jgi:threonine dehydratase
MKTPQLPVPKLAQTLGLTTELWFKREDLHKHGSQKGRSIPLMIKEYYRQGIRKFVISSSGNAALSAIIDIQNHNLSKSKEPLSLTIFVGERIEQKKFDKLKKAITDPNIKLEKTEYAKANALQLEKKNPDTKYLRQSTDELALRGYTELADELAKIPELQAVFIPTSSGTTAQGLVLGFQKLTPPPQLHIVQTSSCHPIVDIINPEQTQNLPEETSFASGIVDNIGHRKETLAEAIKASNGNGWIITNEEIKNVIELTKKTTDVTISATSALSVAGLQKALKNGWKPTGTVVCLITGE